MPGAVQRCLAAAVPIMALWGCAHDRTAPAPRPAVVEQSTALRQAESPYRTVVRGDTLYSIAWEAGQDYRQIATWNDIRPPYTIFPGQQLRVLPPAPAASPAASAPRPASGTASRSAPPKTAVGTSTPKPPAKAPAAAPRPGGAAPAAPRPGAAASTRPPAPAVGSGGDWAWPADGQIIARYGQGDSKGLDIAGPAGAPIRAAASGRVVYQGSGLRGYGQLIIVKHNDDFLSAYAHNDRVYVKEGDVVKRGQKIADMGSSGTDRVKLHFEIRHRGVPVDPLRYLPRR